MIRVANRADGSQIVPLILVILQDMELPFLAKHGYDTTREILETAFLDGSFRYGYKRAIVLEEAGEILGMAYGYTDQDEPIIDRPLEKIFPQFGISVTEKMFDDPEAFPNEWYLDSIAVRADQRGNGVGSRLLKALPQLVKEETGAQRIGLSVDEANPLAKKLYLRQGFKVVGEAMISGHAYEHLQKEI